MKKKELWHSKSLDQKQVNSAKMSMQALILNYGYYKNQE